MTDAQGHMDGLCQQCGVRYEPWFAPHEISNAIVGGDDAKDDPGSILCPTCFINKSHGQVWLLQPAKPNQQALYAAREEGRRAGLEEAAKYHNNFLMTKTSFPVEKVVASTEAIRALIDTPADPVAEAAIPRKGAVDALAHYQQADEDGIMVLVSRQAIDECLPILRALAQKEEE